MIRKQTYNGPRHPRAGYLPVGPPPRKSRMRFSRIRGDACQRLPNPKRTLSPASNGFV